MLEKLLSSLLARPELLQSSLREELERLEKGGYLGREELQRLERKAREALETHAETASSALKPVLSSLGTAAREFLDMPSRSEIEALRQELRQARQANSESGDSGS